MRTIKVDLEWMVDGNVRASHRSANGPVAVGDTVIAQSNDPFDPEAYEARVVSVDDSCIDLAIDWESEVA